MTGEQNRMTTEAVISRLVDGEGSPEDWRAFRAMAEREPSLWRELAECQQDHAELCAAVNAAIAVADEVEVDVRSEMARRFSERMRLVASWGGWAAAAAVVLAWATGMRTHTVNHPSDTGQATLNPLGHLQPEPLTATDAFNAYLEKGREAGFVVGELPRRTLIEARPVKGGGYEVLYLRQVLERQTVREISTLTTDEWGNTVVLPATVLPQGLPSRTPIRGDGPF